MLADISVIIPAYNRAELIGETLRSLLKQTVPAKEIIVVDDGSTDGTDEAVEREFSVFREQFSALHKPSSVFSVPSVVNPSLRVIRQQNAGPGAARNRGLAEATGEFIHFFDSDDIASPNKHEVQLRALLENGADIAYGPWVKGRFVNLTTEDTTEHRGRCEMEQPQVGPKGERVGTIESKNTEEEAVLRLGKPSGAAFSNPSKRELARDSENTSLTRSAMKPADRFSSFRFQISGFSAIGPVLQARGLPQGDLLRALLTNWSVIPHACLFRRSILQKVGGFPEDIWVGEDQLLFLRCLLAGAKVVHTPETMVFYRLGEDPGKLTAIGAAQKRHARDWARFLVKANQEVSSAEWRVVGKTRCVTTEDTTEHRGRCEMEQPKVGPKGERVGTIESKNTEEEAVLRLGKPSGAAFSNPSKRELARDSENTSLTRSAMKPADRFSSFRFQISGFSAIGPVLQARGLPQGDLLRALLTNWSVIPHACLFRRSILQKVGGFPEDIWVGEDQLLFLRCLLAGAKVVHTPETMVFYRLGEDPGKLTAIGAAQKRHARDWARFLVKANQEVSSAEWRVVGKTRCVTTEDTTEHRGRCEMEQPKVGPKGERVGTIESKNTEEEDGAGLASQAGLQMDNKKNHTIHSANDLLASRKQSDENPVNLVNPVKNCFGFRLRAYEAWRDLEKFFPAEENELKNELQGIWKRNSSSVFSLPFSGFLLRKLGGLKLRVLGYREHASFRCRKLSSFIDFGS